MAVEPGMNAIDRHARKQVLLTRIAFDRAELARAVAQVGASARVPNLLRAALGEGVARSLFDSEGAGRTGGWLNLGLALLRRYRIAAALLGATAPLWRGRGRWRRVARIAGLTAAVAVGWRALRARDADDAA
jgi:hypothetical protein